MKRCPVALPEADTLANPLLVAGDPVADTRFLADPENSRKVVMKDGRYLKNALQ